MNPWPTRQYPIDLLLLYVPIRLFNSIRKGVQPLKPAIIVVDMVKDNFHDEDHLPITAQARAMVPALNRLIKESRSNGASRSFLPVTAFWKAILFFRER